MAGSLERQLRELGYEGPPIEFKRTLIAVKESLYPDTSADDLVCDDDESLKFCEAVRSRLAVNLPNKFIRIKLLNLRKKPLAA